MSINVENDFENKRTNKQTINRSLRLTWQGQPAVSNL